MFFDDISMFDAKNPIDRSLLTELNVGKKDIASELIKKAPRPPGVDFAISKRLEKLKNRPEPKDDDDNFIASTISTMSSIIKTSTSRDLH